MSQITFTYSQLSAQSVSFLLSDVYDIGEIRRCVYYVLGLHDNYLVETPNGKFILRIYRNEWRSPDEINFELRLLNFLHQQQAPVSSPILTLERKLCFELDAPEGKRLAVLFPYAKGESPGNNITLRQSELLGRTVATTHRLSDSFEYKGKNKNLDISHLLDDSISAIEPFLVSRDIKFLTSLKDSIKNALPNLPKHDEIYGPCLGDVNLTNFHIDAENITLFDFDQCGYAFRAFELAKFKSSLYSIQNKEDLFRSFLHGYQEIRLLDKDELKSIPYYEIIALIWVMAIHAINANRIGYKMLEKPFWRRRLTIVEALAKELD